MQKQFSLPFAFRIFATYLDMVKLIIDQGNTRTKVALFESDTILKQGVLSSIDEIAAWSAQASRAIVSSVNVADEMLSFLSAIPIIRLGETTPVPIINRYATPETLGNDRLAAVVAGAKQFSKQNVLLIDAGTCITFDFLNAQNEYLGGSIAPGLLMRAKALHAQTARLPLVTLTSKSALVGTDTISSMQSGIINGALAEIDGIIDRYKQQYPDLKVLMTGGDAAFFDKGLKNSIFADPNLVLKGLNEILDYNEANS